LALLGRSGSGAHWDSATSVNRALYPGFFNRIRYMAYFPWMVSFGDSKCFTGTRLKGQNDTTCSQIGGCASQAAGDD
jgi:hypothetical protein